MQAKSTALSSFEEEMQVTMSDAKVYYNDSNYKCAYLKSFPKLKLVACVWEFSCPQETAEEVSNSHAVFAEDCACTLVLNDLRSATHNLFRGVEYIKDVYKPGLAAAGVKRIAYLLPDTSLMRLTVKNLKAQLPSEAEVDGLESETFFEVNAAMAWLYS